MDRQQLITSLEGVLELAPGTFRDELKIRDLEHWDSLKLLEIVALVDEQFHLQIEASRLVKCVTVGELAGLIEETAAAKTA